METPVIKMNGIGPKRAQMLQKLGISTVGELLMTAPVDYRDVSDVVKISGIKSGMLASFTARVVSPPRFTHVPGRKLTVLRLRLEDETGQIDAVYFNRPYVKNVLKEDTVWRFSGRISKSGAKLSVNPEYEKPGLEDSATLIPIYSLTRGVSQSMMRQLVKDAFESCPKTEETLDEQTIRDYDLMPLEMALYRLHYPRDEHEMKSAVRRLAFEKLLNYQLAMGIRRQQRVETRTGVSIETNWDDMNKLMASLPYKLTQSQMLTISEVLDDMESSTPMNRLIQGDVGSGKTIVAAMAMFSVAMNKRQAIFMAPTEMLARQHFETLSKLFSKFGIRTGLFTGAMPKSERKAAIKSIAAGDWQIIIGTHALISSDVIYHRLSLVVTDEQHRFGVGQRTLAMAKAETPHMLVMSATPIPRTLSLVLYADLDVSVINELPVGRIPVKTRLVPEYKRKDLYIYLRSRIREGEKCFVVCPLVEESEKITARSAEEVYDELTAMMPKGTVAMVHGRMNAQRKAEAIDDFAAGRTPILVSTTVIEVGIDVPDATIMIIENASRYGLATLHQLRGRVGRGSKESWCFLVSGDDSKTALDRLNTLVESNDGFEIASKDLEMRGPGELLGVRQHGASDDDILASAKDIELVKQTRDAAQSLLLREDAQAHRVISGALAKFDQISRKIALN